MRIKDSNITINVSNIEASISFYQAIGFTLKERWGDHYAQLTAPGITIGLHPSKTQGETKSSGILSIGFTTEDLSQARDTLKKLGIPVTERSEEGGNFLHFSDPDGTSLYCIEPRW